MYKNGEKILEELEAELVVYRETIQKVDIYKSTRILGVYISPLLSWKGQFKVMRKKLNISITKLVAIDINPF